MFLRNPSLLSINDILIILLQASNELLKDNDNTLSSWSPPASNTRCSEIAKSTKLEASSTTRAMA